MEKGYSRVVVVFARAAVATVPSAAANVAVAAAAESSGQGRSQAYGGPAQAAIRTTAAVNA